MTVLQIEVEALDDDSLVLFLKELARIIDNEGAMPMTGRGSVAKNGVESAWYAYSVQMEEE